MSEDQDFREPRPGPWQQAWLVLKVVQARLRFVAILVGIAAAIYYWPTLKGRYEKWAHAGGQAQAADSDIEYFCPMHPQIIRDHPDTCPICFMPLSKRKKGESTDEPWEPGRVSRVQLSPYRVALAGVETSEVAYQRMTKDIETVGFVEFDERKQKHIAARVKGRIDKLYVNVTGQMVKEGDELALLYSPDLVVTVQNLLDADRSGNQDLLRMARQRLQLWDIDDRQINEILRTKQANTHLTIRSPISGHVIRKYQVEGQYVEEGAALYDIADLSTVWIEAQVYEDELSLLKVGQSVSATTAALPNQDFPGKVAFVHPHLDQATRTLKVRFDMDNPHHELRPGMYATVKLQIPVTQLDMFQKTVADEWRDRTAVDMLTHALASPAGLQPPVGIGAMLQAGVQQGLLQQGLVLAVPETAVIDTGDRKIVYREVSPGVYEGVEVRLGPRNEVFYPVVRGLEAGDRIVTAGSFLIDAETRLNPAAGSIYFGGSSGSAKEGESATVRPSMTADPEDEVKTNRAGLKPMDRRLVEAQDVCPILETNRLGAMGPPVKVTINGQPVFLCCKGCVKAALDHPQETLTKVEQLKAKTSEKKGSPETIP